MTMPCTLLRPLRAAAALLLLLALWSCTPSTEPVDSGQTAFPAVPAHFPPVPVPDDNPLTEAKALLGRRLFYDGRLSLDGTVSCASCHRQEFAFADGGLPVSRGVNNEVGFRNTPTIINTAYLTTLALDGRSSSLEQQTLLAVLNPMEMRADTAVVSLRLRSDSTYRALFTAAFGAGTEVNTHHAVRAIATFVRMILSGSSRYDRFLHGDQTALTPGEHRGRELFFSERMRCGSCHSGHDLTDGKFHNTGLYMHYIDKGRYYTTGNPQHVGQFKTPSLRNIAVTAPYMHDGSLRTLEQVLEHYDRGGHPNMQRDTLMHPLHLTPQETADLVDFMRSLTDEALLRDTRFAAP